MSKPVHANSWDALRAFTDARIALGRTGASLPTDELLRFGLAHAQARDAVHQPFDSERLAADLHDAGWPTLAVHSQAADRAAYLRRPDLGRRLASDSRSLLLGSPSRRVDLLLIVADGLSSKAVHRQALPLLQALRPYLDTLGLTVAPVVLAHQARVALGMRSANACRPGRWRF